MLLQAQMHPRAFYALALVLLAGNAGCEDRTRWFSSLSTVLKNCPQESWNSSGQEEFLEKFRRCVQERVLASLDTLLRGDVIPVFAGLDLVRFQEDGVNSTYNDTDSDPGDEANWTAIIAKRLLRVLRSHVFKVDVDRLTIASPSNNSETEVGNGVFEGRRRHRRRHNHMMPLLMMGFVLMGTILIPMGFQFLAVLGGKALLLAKMALILSSIQGLKKIASNGVNYGLYHTPVAEGWHERSHIEPPPHFDLPFPPHMHP
ncbi:DUF1676 domain-containing protein Osi23 isoform X2 [Andrena cerasifolii]|uniref:DUF1676 domain-containing protein Osi23 isoform X2 n=1 Tax=Andrena cerasifolii TaxID=2819439 RepID=UPI0040376796